MVLTIWQCLKFLARALRLFFQYTRKLPISVGLIAPTALNLGAIRQRDRKVFDDFISFMFIENHHMPLTLALHYPARDRCLESIVRLPPLYALCLNSVQLSACCRTDQNILSHLVKSVSLSGLNYLCFQLTPSTITHFTSIFPSHELSAIDMDLPN